MLLFVLVVWYFAFLLLFFVFFVLFVAFLLLFFVSLLLFFAFLLSFFAFFPRLLGEGGREDLPGAPSRRIHKGSRLVRVARGNVCIDEFRATESEIVHFRLGAAGRD